MNSELARFPIVGIGASAGGVQALEALFFACGVVLSGGDGDGTLGVKAIKERNGLTLAQTADGSGSQNPDMPESAISSGLIDIAVPAHDMGDRLSDFARGFKLLDGLCKQEADSRDKDLQRAVDESMTFYAISRSRFLGLQEQDVSPACASPHAGDAGHDHR